MYGSSALRVRFGRGRDWHSRLAMTQGGYYSAGGFFSSIKKGFKKAVSTVRSVARSPLAKAFAPVAALGNSAKFKALAGNIPGIGGAVRLGNMFGESGVGQGTMTAFGALGPALTDFGVWGSAVKGATAAVEAAGGSIPYDRPALPGEMRPSWFGNKRPSQAGVDIGMKPSHVPFGGKVGASKGGSSRRRRDPGAELTPSEERYGIRKRRRRGSTRRRSSATRRRAPTRRRGGLYRRGDYGDDWSGNRPSRAKGSGRFLTRRGGRHHHRRQQHHHRRGGRVSFVTKSGRRVSFTPRHHHHRRRRHHGASGTY